MQRGPHFRPVHCTSVASYDQLGFKLSEHLHRPLCRLKIRCEIHRRSVQLRFLNRDRVSGFHPGRDECVTCHDRAITFPQKRNVTGGMSGRVQPAPAWHSRHAALIGQHLEPAADIDGTARKKLCHPWHDTTTDHRIRRRIGRRAVKIRHFEFVAKKCANYSMWL